MTRHSDDDYDKWEMYAEMIRSDQMTHDQVMQFLEDRPNFAAWYEGLYVNTNRYELHNGVTEESFIKWADANPDNEWVQHMAAIKIREIWRRNRK